MPLFVWHHVLTLAPISLLELVGTCCRNMSFFLLNKGQMLGFPGQLLVVFAAAHECQAVFFFRLNLGEIQIFPGEIQIFLEEIHSFLGEIQRFR